MAFVFSAAYSAEAKVAAQVFYETLSEKDQRRYVAVEARRIGFGGIEYLASVFGCSRKTIERGMAELKNCPTIRQLDACAGQAVAEKKVATEPQLERNLSSLLAERTAGDHETPVVISRPASHINPSQFW